MSTRGGSANPRSTPEGSAESNELDLELSDATFATESAIDDDTRAWARERRFAIGTPNVLVVTKVRDPAATLELFKAAYPPRYLRQNIEPFLTRLPLRLELPWPELALLLDALRTADSFDYEVNPS